MRAFHLDRERSRALWREARGFEDLCSLAERFVAGEIAHFPGWGACTLDVESDALRDDLARLARAGWLTTCSQPGRLDPGRDSRQRAFVAGFASETLAARVRELAANPGLGARIARRGAESAVGVPVTIEGGAPRVVIGGPAIEAELECFEEDVAPSVLSALADLPYVVAWDEEFGPSERLWRALRALGARAP